MYGCVALLVKKPHVVAACDDLQREKQYEEAVVAKPNAIVHALTVVVAPEDAAAALRSVSAAV